VTAQAGSVLGQFEMRIELGKVREFARATGASDPAYFSSEAPPIPPTFLMTTAFWQPEGMLRPYEALGMNLKRVLHGEQRFSFFTNEPIRVGDVLHVEVRIEDVRTKKGRRGGTMRLARIVTDFRDLAGNLVAQGRSSTIETDATAQ
jgi:hypothetical protein